MNEKLTTDGIILDIDGTIWNTTEIVAVAWNAAIDECGLDAAKVTADMLKKEFGKPMDVIARDLWENLTASQQAQLLDKCCKLEQEALEKNTTDIAYPGAVSTIKKLSEKCPIYIVSNCQDGYIQLVMQKNGITGCITDFECFGHTGFSKGKNISLIIERNGIKKPVYLGDTQGDYEACKEAGVPFIFASYGFGKPEGYAASISSFPELESVTGF